MPGKRPKTHGTFLLELRLDGDLALAPRFTAGCKATRENWEPQLTVAFSSLPIPCFSSMLLRAFHAN